MYLKWSQFYMLILLKIAYDTYFLFLADARMFLDYFYTLKPHMCYSMPEAPKRA